MTEPSKADRVQAQKLVEVVALELAGYDGYDPTEGVSHYYYGEARQLLLKISELVRMVSADQTPPEKWGVVNSKLINALWDALHKEKIEDCGIAVKQVLDEAGRVKCHELTEELLGGEK